MHRFHVSAVWYSILLYLLLLGVQLAKAGSIDQKALLLHQQPRQQQQRRIRHKHHPTSAHLDPAPNTVGVLFGGPDEEDAVHVWLPLGRKVYTRENPALPLHPLRARITSMIADTPRRAASEVLGAIRCVVYFAHEVEGETRVEFSKKDGLVRFGVNWSPFWLREGTAVEAYECS